MGEEGVTGGVGGLPFPEEKVEEIQEKVGEGSSPLDTHLRSGRMLRDLEMNSKRGPNSSPPPPLPHGRTPCQGCISDPQKQRRQCTEHQRGRQSFCKRPDSKYLGFAGHIRPLT